MAEPGQLLHNRYRLVRRITERGGSSTYEGVDTHDGTRCIVKELHVGEVIGEASSTLTYDGDDFTKLIDLFEREARVLAHLDVDAVPRLLDHFRIEEGGETRLYSVQELVEGRTLEELVESGRHFTEEEARDLCRRLVTVLDALHRRSPPLIHRDIKPSNVILDDEGSVHLVDFGSVRNVREPDVLDGKTIVGTYGYMPIEQYEGRAVPQSDFYALGMTLVYLLSHKDPTRIPRTGLTLDFRDHVNVSDAFASVIEWMIAPAPEDRPAEAGAIVAALDGSGGSRVPRGRAATRVPLDQALPVSAVETEHARRLARRRSGLVLGAGVAALSGVFLALFLSFGGSMPGVGTAPVRPEAGATRGSPPAPAAVTVAGGALTLDLDRDFQYVGRGWPMGRSVAQTSLPALVTEPRSPLVLPSGRDADELLFGQIVLGDAADNRYDFALASDAGAWSLYLDVDNDEDLSNDGPARPNEGSGPIFAGNASVDVRVGGDGFASTVRPYAFWVWFTEPSGGGIPYGRMYARHHYRGAVELDGVRYEATVFEFSEHDGLYRDDGVCIDLSRDGECQEDAELFYHGDVITAGGDDVRLELDYR